MPDNVNWQKWHKEAEADVYRHVVAAFRILDAAQGYRKRRNLDNIRTAGLRVDGLGPAQYARREEKSKPRYNCIEAGIDALVSHIGSNKPSPYFLTDGGNYAEQRQAEACTKAVVGQFYAAGTYSLLRKMLADALRMDGGVIKSFIRDGEVVDRLVFPNDLLIDDTEAYHGRYRQCFEIEYRDREEVIEETEDSESLSKAEKEAKIESIRAAGRIRDADWVHSGLADQIALIHAYWLPSRAGKKGKYALVTDTCTLLVEEWGETWSPYTIHVWMEQTQGVWGKGAAEQFGGLQKQLDAHQRKISRLTTLGTSKLYVDRLMQINPADLNNDDLGVVLGNGPNPPKLLSTLSIPAELLQEKDWLRAAIFEGMGVSQLMLTAKVQPGMESAVGVRAVADQQAGRFRKASDAMDETAMVVARKHIVLAKKIPNYKVTAMDDDNAYEIAWKDLNPKVLERQIKVWPTNLMQGSPSMQLDTGERLARLGVIGAKGLVRMFKVKDLEAATKSITASQRVVERLIERMLDPENPEYKGPEPFMLLDGPDGALTVTQNAYLDALLRGAPERNLAMLRNFIMAADQMNKQKLREMAMVQAEAQVAAQTKAQPPPGLAA